MTTAGTPTGKLDVVAKWSLIIGPILVVVFNFLLPTNGIEPLDPEKSTAFIEKLGADNDLNQIYFILILFGIILYTRGLIGLWRIAPEGDSRYRLGIGLMGSVAALALWATAIGVGLAESSVANDFLAAKAGAAQGSAEAGVLAAGALTISKALHAAFFGIYQMAAYVAFISLIPIGGGLAISGIVRKEFGWAITLIGALTVILVSVFPVKTEEGIMVFGIFAAVWGVAFLATGLQIARQDMDSSTE